MVKRPQLCPKCRKLVGAEDETCYQCGANLGMSSRLMHGSMRQAKGAGQTMPWWRLVLLLNVALFIIGLGVTLVGGGELVGGGLFNMLSPSNSVQLQLGLQVPQLVFSGDYWRMITCLFLHGGLIHLGFNMYFLAQLGPTAEQTFGSRGFLLIYILGGFIGSAAELALGNPVLGASGSIMALIGALAGLGIIRSRTWKNDLTREMVRIIVYVTVFGMIVGGVAHGAHLGGFVGGGLVLGLVHGLRQRRLFRVLDGLGYATAGMVLLSFAMMGFNLSKPTLAELQAYEQCVQKGLRQVVGGDKARRAPWDCAQELSEQLPSAARDVLSGLGELIDQPQSPAGQEVLTELMQRHNEWLRAEARRFGISP
ncbi:MAG: rhomboid family intramembrane serine protease [Myxococcota bacterium]|nr:rhomboid family intramembrane serine protease [Myxococcota bacterium]